MHILSHLILTADTDGGLGRLPAPGHPADEQCRGLPAALRPHVPSGLASPPAHAGQTTTWHPPIPAWVWAPADTQYLTNYQNHEQCNCVCRDVATLHHPLWQQRSPSSRHQGLQEEAALPKCLSWVGQRMCFSSKLPVNLDAALGSLFGDPLSSPTLEVAAIIFPLQVGKLTTDFS